MEWTIPLQTLDPTKVRFSQPYAISSKPLANLSYTDGEIRFPNVSMLLPLATIQSYDAVSGRLSLVVSSSEALTAKFVHFQDTILHMIHSQQQVLLKGESFKSMDELRAGFQPMIENGAIKLYCPSGSTAPQGISELPIYLRGKWIRGLQPSMLAAGKSIRLALRIQGVSFHLHPASQQWTGKFRLQHRILAILIQ